MGKQSREERRMAQQAAERERQAAAERRRRQLRVGIGAGTLATAGVVVAVVLLLAGSSALGAPPAGTQVFAETNHAHTASTVHYDRVPPAGGAHNSVWLNCGVYSGPVPNVNAVHSLEHGAVWITYRPDISVALLSLQRLVESHYVGTQRDLILSPYPGLPAPVVASAWGAQLRLQNVSDPRLVAFIKYYAGGGQGTEAGAPCTGGTGSPMG